VTQPEDQLLEIAMGRMLRIGVSLSAFVVLVGGALYLREFHGSIPDYSQFHSSRAPYRSVTAILASLTHLESKSLIDFGILLLIATPISRVLFGVIGFSMEKDRMYAAVSAVILAILLASLFTGR
jgi:uncharacterized membrane protein